MEDVLKKVLNCSNVVCVEGSGSGWISSTSAYLIDGKKVFVKENSKPGSRTMFEGEFASLRAIQETNTVKVPNPVKVFESCGKHFIAAEFLEMKSLNKHAKKLGQDLAELHLHNSKQKAKNLIGKSDEKYVDKFGFDIPTSCGFIAMNNEWKTKWVEFFFTCRLKSQLDLIEQSYGDRDARDLWPKVQRNVNKIFPSDLEVTPSLLHGDLWAGNTAETNNKACVFDPAAFYGHHEYDLAISQMFGGFPREFFIAYHEIIPKQPGFDQRQKAYMLFHYLNHWNHFGSGYKGSSISLMQQLAQL